MNAVYCVLDFIRVCEGFPNKYITNSNCSKEDWVDFVYDTIDLFLAKWGF